MVTDARTEEQRADQKTKRRGRLVRFCVDAELFRERPPVALQQSSAMTFVSDSTICQKALIQLAISAGAAMPDSTLVFRFAIQTLRKFLASFLLSHTLFAVSYLPNCTSQNACTVTSRSRGRNMLRDSAQLVREMTQESGQESYILQNCPEAARTFSCF